MEQTNIFAFMILPCRLCRHDTTTTRPTHLVFVERPMQQCFCKAFFRWKRVFKGANHWCLVQGPQNPCHTTAQYRLYIFVS